MWFSTAGGGVTRFDGEVFQTLTEEDGLPSHFIQGIVEDDAGDMWLGDLESVVRFRVNGYDTDWRTTRERRVEYQDLPRGDYSFEVTAIRP